MSGSLTLSYLVHSQLQAQEEKKKGCLVSDRLPQLLTSDAFIEQVVQFEVSQVEKAAKLEQRHSAREERLAALEEWKCRDEERKDCNNVIRDLWQEAVQDWEAEQDKAKAG